jgi:hypothetical protein
LLRLLAATPTDDGELWVVRTSVRDVAARLAVRRTPPSGAAVLRDAGLVTVIQDRAHSGRF